MSRKKRRNFEPAFKAKVVLEALKEQKTMSQLATKFALHPNQITTWKKEFLQNAAKVFVGDMVDSIDISDMEKKQDELHKHIGHQTMEIEFLKKNLIKLNL